MHHKALTLLFGAASFVATPSYAAAPAPTSGRLGIVAADHQLASKAGIELLKAGGNAIDAACGTAFAQGVVNSAGSGIGGGGFMLIHLQGKPGPIVLDFREVGPSATNAKTFMAPGLPAHASRRGGLAVAVPGEVAGCALALKRYGRLSLRKVLQPAIRLARKGFSAGRQLVKGANWAKGHLARFPELGRILAPKGKLLTFGQKTRRPKLAKALMAIARRGPDVFYKGWIAKDMVDTVRRHGGVLTLKDLADYRVRERKALHTRFLGHDVYTMPPPSSGGIVIATALNMLGARKLKQLGHNSSRYLHLLSETLKHTFADRSRFMGDPDFVKVPTKELTAPAYARALLSRIGERAQPIKSYGSKTPPKAPVARDAGTSHLGVIDRWGNAVSLTSSINTLFGSLVTGKRSGIILNNTMDDFNARPTEPNFFGLMESERNVVAKGKRPLSSMSPTIVTQGGKVRLLVGGSGGPTIITGVLQVLLNVVAFGMNVADGVHRSRIHHQWLPDQIWIESDLPADVVKNLQRRGQKTKLIKRPFTAVQAAAKDDDGTLSAASDPRKFGAPASY